MEFLSLEPFVPSGGNLELAKAFFREIGFTINWDAGDFVGFQRDDCRFILQKYDAPEFAEPFTKMGALKFKIILDRAVSVIWFVGTLLFIVRFIFIQEYLSAVLIFSFSVFFIHVYQKMPE